MLPTIVTLALGLALPNDVSRRSAVGLGLAAAAATPASPALAEGGNTCTFKVAVAEGDVRNQGSHIATASVILFLTVACALCTHCLHSPLPP